MLKVNHTFNVNAIKIKYRHRKDRHRCRSFVNFTGYMCTLGKAIIEWAFNKLPGCHRNLPGRILSKNLLNVSLDLWALAAVKE